ncbi:unnamed protein product [Sphagnum troendelagicum]
MAGWLNGAAAGNRRAQGEQMSQWTNKSNIGRRRMQCAYCDVYGHIGIASAEAFQGLILALLQPQRCEVYWRIWQLTFMWTQQIFHLLTQSSLFPLPLT